MEEIAAMSASLFMDRGYLKMRVNMKKGDCIFGFIRPVSMEGRG